MVLDVREKEEAIGRRLETEKAVEKQKFRVARRAESPQQVLKQKRKLQVEQEAEA